VRRVLPIPGDVLVKAGDRVNAQTVVARTYMPGDITPVNLANQLSLGPAEAPGALLKKEGERIEKGEPLARTKGLFGFFQSEFASPAGGTIESISSVTGQLMIRGEPLPIQVLAYLAGTVVEVVPNEGVVIEAEAAIVQGIFGIGGEAYGKIRIICDGPDQEVGAARITDDCRGQVLVGGGRIHEEAIRRAVKVGAAAIVGGGIDDDDLKAILGYDLGVAITGSEHIGVSVIITEGFGDVTMARRTFELLKRHAGQEAAVNGATQIRAGVMRPEIVIPAATGADTTAAGEARGGGILAVKSRVRMIRDPYFGQLGRVSALPHEPQVLETGSKARILTVSCDDGREIVVPRANVELVSEAE
jgi:hypothetical protein